MINLDFTVWILILLFAPVAQWIEQRFPKPLAAGSTPVRGDFRKQRVDSRKQEK